jgi:hypothetical protein
MRSLDPYPDRDSQFGSGFKRAKIAQKNTKQLINFYLLKCWMLSFEGWRLLMWLVRPLWRPTNFCSKKRNSYIFFTFGHQNLRSESVFTWYAGFRVHKTDFDTNRICRCFGPRLKLLESHTLFPIQKSKLKYEIFSKTLLYPRTTVPQWVLQVTPILIFALLFTVICLQAGGHKQQGFNIPFVGLSRSDPQRLGLPGVNLFNLG